MALQPSPFHSLVPLELIVCVLGFLDAKSLSRCAQTCRGLHAVVRDTKALQYIGNLAIFGLHDGNPDLYPLHQRKSMLSRHSTAWKQLAWTHHDRMTVPLRGASACDLYGDLLAYSTGERAIQFIRMPSILRQVQGVQWEHQYEFEPFDFAVDPSCDLIILVEALGLNEYFRDAYRIHLRCLGSGEPHPLAAVSEEMTHHELSFDLIEDEVGMDIQIHGDYFGILFDDEDAGSEIVVWNWKTGNLELKFTQSWVQSFAFLDETHILVAVTVSPTASWTGPSVRVYQLTGASLRDINDESTLCTTLALPLTYANPSDCQLIIHSRPQPRHQPVRGPFSIADSEDRLVIIQYMLDRYDDEERKVFTFVTRAKLISSLLPMDASCERWGAILPWDHWRHHTRLLGDTPPPRWMHHTHGMRYIFPAPLEFDGVVMACILDFHPIRIWTAIESPERDSVMLPESAFAPESLMKFKERWYPRGASNGQLPYRETLVALPEALQTEGDVALMLSSDTIIAIQEAPDDLDVNEPSYIVHLLTF
ncbi:hypothetical protein BV25DRAFT_1829332 [Artomyces pyxidatus]|uniref:Uncharacterized protein n=1 Tax=Artomyces pyxidatus TaxID=48021 RepID=A0ACB8SRG7_9AGAM|nr:hypothetical protein BV25DRAFT_1829332 [Artomyces pyxidatus]